MGLFKSIFGKKDDYADEENDQTEDVQDQDYSDSQADNDFNQYDNQSDNDDEVDEEQQFYDNQRAPSTVLGQPSLINVIANSYWSTDDVMQEYFIMRETMKHRT